MNQISLSPNFFESAYSRSMSTTKIILIISSSTKIPYLEDILLKCVPKKQNINLLSIEKIFDDEKVGHFLLMISGVVVK